jgi:hypothetical protein
MICPQCLKTVPSKSLFLISGKEGASCPHCKASLCPRATCAVVLFLLSCVLGDAALILMRHAGAPSWLAFSGFFVVFAAAYAVCAPLILRLRVRHARPSTLGEHHV